VLSKGVERILCDQFVEYIESCGFLSRFQSSSRRFHSPATGLTSGDLVVTWWRWPTDQNPGVCRRLGALYEPTDSQNG
jgi:hypothetical protein